MVSFHEYIFVRIWSSMTQIPLFEFSIWSVSELTRYLRDLLESDDTLQDLWVRGEISNLARPISGHLYFTLKETTSALKCVIWRNSVLRLSFVPREGQAVEAHGSISIYETGGQYQLYIDQLRPAGEGALYQEFLRLKSRLETEGLFDPERKRPVPRFPQKIGVVTSPTGAALRDILNTLRRRYSVAEVILAPSSVQGENAPVELISALQNLNKSIHPDVILLARGGGSIEDLWAFNDEQLAYAIAASEAPVISGVGHETDFTIADFVSDMRAPTPTAAAELATPNRFDLKADLTEFIGRLNRSFQSVITTRNWQVERLQNRLLQRSPVALVLSSRQRLDDMTSLINRSMAHMFKIKSTGLIGVQQHLSSLNPFSILKRGYAVVTRTDGTLVHSISQVQVGDNLAVLLQDGKFPVTVQETLTNEQNI
jgi:exodeoxyribonuclease VII large subunit